VGTDQKYALNDQKQTEPPIFSVSDCFFAVKKGGWRFGKEKRTGQVILFQILRALQP
jgi:hypothetical protein